MKEGWHLIWVLGDHRRQTDIQTAVSRDPVSMARPQAVIKAAPQCQSHGGAPGKCDHPSMLLEHSMEELAVGKEAGGGRVLNLGGWPHPACSPYRTAQGRQLREPSGCKLVKNTAEISRLPWLRHSQQEPGHSWKQTPREEMHKPRRRHTPCPCAGRFAVWTREDTHSA